jgi:hypothetical protein
MPIIDGLHPDIKNFMDWPISSILTVIVFALFKVPVYTRNKLEKLKMVLNTQGIIEETYYVIKTINFTSRSA